MEKFQNKYRIPSHRKPGWDYSANAMYYITFVIQHRNCCLGKIINGEMQLSDFGKIIESEWYKSFKIRNELFLDEFIIMPNHLHAIIILNNQNEIDSDGNGTVGCSNGDGCSNVETHGRASLHSTTSPYSITSPHFTTSPQPSNLHTINSTNSI